MSCPGPTRRGGRVQTSCPGRLPPRRPHPAAFTAFAIAAALLVPAFRAEATPAGCASHTTGVCRAGIAHPAGVTAQCKDGTYSTSKTFCGTCSHHGGVRYWYKYEDHPDLLASLLRVRHWVVRRLARGWANATALRRTFYSPLPLLHGLGGQGL
ncbi:DUF3761 domain-containing protein [Streptomyces sp. NPDC001933]|uniref:DUF3761 domain-containing protein n=1 Tax=Streptomyces sp. NPDC001933 TaxID=3364626 RepID=UPI0036CF2ECA